VAPGVAEHLFLVLEVEGRLLAPVRKPGGVHREVGLRRVAEDALLQLRGVQRVALQRPLHVEPFGDERASGAPYVAWREDTGGPGSIYVKHWTGTGWLQDGPALNAVAGADASDPTLAVDGPVLYATWRETSGGLSQIYVAHWTGSAWVRDGPGLANDPTQPLSRPAIGFYNRTPYVAWSEGAGGIRQAPRR